MLKLSTNVPTSFGTPEANSTAEQSPVSKKIQANTKPCLAGGIIGRAAGTVEGTRSFDVMPLARAGCLSGHGHGGWQGGSRNPQVKQIGGAIAPATTGRNVMDKPIKTAVLAKVAKPREGNPPLQKSPRAQKASARIDLLIGEPETDELRAFGGSRSDKFNGALINAMARTGWFPPGQTVESCNQQMFAAVAALRAFKPTDEIEGMLAAQTMAMHFGAMECFRRAMVHDQHPEVASKLRKDGANLARGMTDMIDALDRKRGKGPQVVRVERVVVHEGGQAIVGNVQPAASRWGRGRDDFEVAEKTQAGVAQLANNAALGSSLAAMWRTHQDGHAL